MQSEPLVNIIRSSIIESEHRGIISIVHGEGQEIKTVGDTRTVTFIRSAAKPIQVLPFIASGALEDFKITDRELAVMCSSHNGEPVHIKAVQGILEKGNFSVEDLECGVHLPIDRKSARDLLARGEEPSALHNNCSGKHAGMLLLCRHMGWDHGGYIQKGHPLQNLLHETVAQLAGMSQSCVPVGVDGCGVAVFGLPVYKMAYLFACLANPENLPEKFRTPAEKVLKAMEREPYMVAGKGRLCTALLEQMGNRLVSKSGAEGVYCIGLRNRDLGMAVKIADGNGRGMGAITGYLLNSLGVVTEDDLPVLREKFYPVIKNNRGENVGRIEPCFSLGEVLDKDEGRTTPEIT